MWSTVTTDLASTDDVPERDRRHERAEADALGTRGKGGEGHPGVHRTGGVATQDRAVVIGAEHAVEPCGLGGERQREELLPGDALLAFEHEADAHRQVIRAPDSASKKKIVPSLMRRWIRSPFSGAAPGLDARDDVAHRGHRATAVVGEAGVDVRLGAELLDHADDRREALALQERSRATRA